MAYAQAADIEARLGRTLDSSETLIVNARLNDAELLIKSRIRDLDARIDAGTILEDAVVMVEADMVIRLIRNPEGYTQESDGNYSYMVDARVASGRLTVLDDEWALLGVRRGAFLMVPKVHIPWECEGTNPLHDFAPPAPPTGDDYMAVWWGDA